VVRLTPLRFGSLKTEENGKKQIRTSRASREAKEEDPRVWLLILIQYWHAGRNSEMI
jgi:hypothetical protein